MVKFFRDAFSSIPCHLLTFSVPFIHLHTDMHFIPQSSHPHLKYTHSFSNSECFLTINPVTQWTGNIPNPQQHVINKTRTGSLITMASMDTRPPRKRTFTRWSEVDCYTSGTRWDSWRAATVAVWKWSVWKNGRDPWRRTVLVQNSYLLPTRTCHVPSKFNSIFVTRVSFS